MTIKELWEMECPNCNGGDDIEVQVSMWITLTKDGSVVNQGDHEWDSDSLCHCGNCGHSGFVWQFSNAYRDNKEAK